MTELPGDVILAVASTSTDGIYICGGESGIVYFILPLGSEEDPATSPVRFEYVGRLP